MLSLQTLVFPTDDSACAEAARAVAERIARRHGATLHVLHVEVVAPAADLQADGTVPADTVVDGVVEAHRRFPSPSAAIVDYTEAVGGGLIVMGTHGRSGLNRFTLGSTAEEVLRSAPCPVVTVGIEADADASGPVLAPLSFESISDVAMETAVALAEARGTRMIAMHVVEPLVVPTPYALTIEPFDRSDLEDRVEETLDRWVRPFMQGPAPVETDVRSGEATSAILEAARESGAGLIVQATHGRRGLRRWLLGSVAEAVARQAPCPVLTIPPDARPLVRMDGRADTLPVPQADWVALCDTLSDRAAAGPHGVSVEVLSPEAEGALYRGVRLLGLTYDPHVPALEVHTADGGHRIEKPFAIRSSAGGWTLDAARDPRVPGPWTLDVVRADGTRERITVEAIGEPVAA